MADNTLAAPCYFGRDHFWRPFLQKTLKYTDERPALVDSDPRAPTVATLQERRVDLASLPFLERVALERRSPVSANPLFEVTATYFRRFEGYKGEFKVPRHDFLSPLRLKPLASLSHVISGAVEPTSVEELPIFKQVHYELRGVNQDGTPNRDVLDAVSLQPEDVIDTRDRVIEPLPSDAHCFKHSNSNENSAPARAVAALRRGNPKMAEAAVTRMAP